MVLASHEHDRATALAGRAVTIAGGRIVDDTAPALAGPVPMTTSTPADDQPTAGPAVAFGPEPAHVA